VVEHVIPLSWMVSHALKSVRAAATAGKGWGMR
jgi:hypothetical protein